MSIFEKNKLLIENESYRLSLWKDLKISRHEKDPLSRISSSIWEEAEILVKKEENDR
jgi:hypothetical protein